MASRRASTLERLRILRQKIITLMQQQMLCYVGCTRCQNPLALVSEIFSFAGAEGATSNYGTSIHCIFSTGACINMDHGWMTKFRVSNILAK